MRGMPRVATHADEVKANFHRHKLCFFFCYGQFSADTQQKNGKSMKLCATSASGCAPRRILRIIQHFGKISGNVPRFISCYSKKWTTVELVVKH